MLAFMFSSVFPACMSVLYVGPEYVLDHLGLYLQMLVSVGVGNSTWVLCKSNKCT